MAQTRVMDLETSIKSLSGVLGCVILTDPSGRPAEIQAFTRSHTDERATREAIAAEVRARDLPQPTRILVFELEAESHFGDRETLERAAELAEQEARAKGPLEEKFVPAPPPAPIPPTRVSRPPITRVVLASTSWSSAAEVALGAGGGEIVGQSEGDKTPLGLKILAEATLDAAGRLVDGLRLTLTGASLVRTFEREAILVIVGVDDGSETIGAALVREGPTSEAAVRATLDAVNRKLAFG